MNPIPWAVLVVLSALTAVNGFRFRSGANRKMLLWYRRPDWPAMYRNMPLVAPALGLGGLAFLIAASPRFLGFDIAIVLPRSVVRLLGFAVVASLPLGFAAWIRLLYRPPRVLIPAWLEEDDVRVGYVAPGPGRFDKLALGAAFISLIAGLGLLGYGLLELM